MKHCKCCGLTKQSSEFYNDASKKDGLSTQCKVCIRAKAKNYRNRPEIREKKKLISREWYCVNREYRSEQNKKNYSYDKEREKKIAQSYGLSLEQYEELLKSQEGLCAICSASQGSKNVGKMVVDHCHETGKIRGLLCHSCNRGLGMLRDSTTLLSKALDYLRNADVGILVPCRKNRQTDSD